MISVHCVGISVVERETNMTNPLFPTSGGSKYLGEFFFPVVLVCLLCFLLYHNLA